MISETDLLKKKGVITHFILVNHSPQDENIIPRVEKMLAGKYPLWQISSQLEEDLKILEYEMITNHFVMQLIEQMNINQIEWSGKERQNHLWILSRKL